VSEPRYRLEFAKGVRRQVERLPGSLYQHVKRLIEGLRQNPRPRQAERLRGASERYKIALGAYRIVYRIEEVRVTILVLKVGKKHGPEFYAEIPDPQPTEE
jgi:mRNA interferase RelE/StbE